MKKILFIIALFSLTSCAKLGIVSRDDVGLRVNSINVGFPKSGGIPVEFELLLTNFTSTDLKIESLEYAVAINEREMLQGTLPSPVTIQAKNASEIVLPITLEYKKVTDSLRSSIAFAQTKYRISGSIVLDTLFWNARTPFTNEGEIKFRDIF